MAKVLATTGYLQSDVELLVEKLATIYSEKKKTIQLTLTGEAAKPYPKLKIAGRTIYGSPITDSGFKYIEEIPHNRPVYAVDAGARILFDLGAYKIIVAKIAAAVWKGPMRIKTLGPIKRIKIVDNLNDAAEWLAEIEIEAAARYAKQYGLSSYILLDRPLMHPPSGRVKKAFHKLFENAWRVVGVPKSSKLKLSTGESLIGYIYRRGEKIYKGAPWVYHPVFRNLSKVKLFKGSIAVAKLSPYGAPFRFDVSWKLVDRVGVENVLGELAYIQDPSSPGYPYPLKAVHQMSRISENELELDRMLLLEELSETNIGKKLLSDNMSVSFKRKYIWGEGV